MLLALGWSAVSAQAPGDIVVDHNVTYCTIDGLDLQLDLFRASTPGRHPAALFIHGGGWTNGSRQSLEGRATEL